ncbi:hypothetical protein HaLaN_16109 [Haematococcus lacustris]|uniref:Uncharacterized protein n=1 Tax=Haematococcus lacustris TaxID=44745 RepID=A0A699ZCU7_HAELA|nr:hypothetical protein HaLaN_16109 [Haematococcus lacustris]
MAREEHGRQPTPPQSLAAVGGRHELAGCTDCTELGHNLNELPVAQWPSMIYQLDVYAVHRKRTVLEWFKQNYPFVHSSSCQLASLQGPRYARCLL